MSQANEAGAPCAASSQKVAVVIRWGGSSDACAGQIGPLQFRKPLAGTLAATTDLYRPGVEADLIQVRCLPDVPSASL